MDPNLFGMARKYKERFGNKFLDGENLTAIILPTNLESYGRKLSAPYKRYAQTGGHVQDTSVFSIKFLSNDRFH